MLVLLDFKLDDYLVCPQHDKITCKNKVHKLEPKIMQVLCLLVSCRGEVLSRKEIASRLWPDSVVGLEVVTRAIFELRKVFNDDSKNPKYIETIAKKGYVFIASIEQEQVSFLKAKRKQIIFFISVFIITLGLLLFLTAGENKPQKEVITKPNLNYQATVLSDGQGDIQSAVLSKDWSQLIYIQKNKSLSNVQLIRKNVKTHQQKVLFEQNKRELRSIVMSPNDADLGYFIRCDKKLCEIIKQNITDVESKIIYQSSEPLKALSISSDGNELVVSIQSKGRLKLAMLKLDVIGAKLIELPMPGTNYLAQFSQSGRALYFVNHQAKSQTAIQYYNINAQKTVILTAEFSRITSLYLESDSSLLVAGKTQGVYAIWRMNLVNQTTSQVMSVPPSTHIYNLIKQEKSQTLFYIQKNSNINIAAQGLPKAVKLADLNSHANDLNGLWSTKNQALFFTSQRTGNYELWRYEKASNRKLTNISADSIEQPVLNHDQTKIAFIALINNQLKLIVYDITKQQTTILQNIDEQSYLLSWALDNQSIYLSISSNNGYDIWQLNLANALNKKILLGAGLIAEENINGNIIFADLNNQRLVRKNKQGDVTVIKSFVDIPLVVRPHALKISGDNFYYMQKNNATVTVFSEPINQQQSSTAPQQHFVLDNRFYVTDLGIDDQVYVVYDHILSKSSKMMLMKVQSE